MAQVQYSLEGASDALRTHGFFAVEDASVGSHVRDKKEKGFPCLSGEGLEFLRFYVLDDQRISDTIKYFLPTCAVGRYREFHSDPNHIFQFRKGGEPEPRVFVALLWDHGSEVVYYSGSHRHILGAVGASNGLFEVPSAALNAAGCSERTVIPFKSGGLTIQDARTGFEFSKGGPIAVVFAAPEVATRWGEMTLNRELVRNVSSISSDWVCLRVRYEGTGADEQDRQSPSGGHGT